MLATPEQRARLDQWLHQLGFVHGNPFVDTEAEQERMLPEYFVDAGFYNLIKGDSTRPQTTLVFAPRGGGKTAHRVMLMAECRPQEQQADTLAVLYTDFEQIIEAFASDLSRVTVRAHLDQILRNAVATLLEALCIDPNLASAFPPSQRSRMQWFCQTYNPQLLSPIRIQHYLRSVETSFKPKWTGFQRAIIEQRLRDFLSGWPVSSHPTGELLVDLVDGTPDPLDDQASSSERLHAFVSLVRVTGLRTVYILVDRLDEMSETARSGPGAVADLLDPLVAHLPLMKLSGSAFKFFLPKAVQHSLLGRPSVRQDRLMICEISWSEDLLGELLQQRLLAFSEGRHRTLAPLCVAPLDTRIEKEIVQFADGSPRRLLRLGELLIAAHCNNPNPSLRLTTEDWNKALSTFRREYIPQLHLDRDRQQLLVGSKQVELTGLEYRFLLSLFEGKGWRDKEELAMQVWNAEAGVTDQAISQLVRRLREKIEPAPSEPIYLITERGSGFRLKHLYEIT